MITAIPVALTGAVLTSTAALAAYDGYLPEALSAVPSGYDAETSQFITLQGDTLPSLAVFADNGTTAQVQIFPNQISAGASTTRPYGPATTYTLSGVTGVPITGVAIGDVTRDGVADILVSNPNQDAVEIYPASGHGTFAGAGSGAPISLATDGAPGEIRLGDLNGDGRPDLVVLEQVGGGQEVQTFLNTGSGTFANEPHVSFTDADGIALGDEDGDGHLDLFVHHGAGTEDVYRGLGDGTYGSILTEPAAGAVAVGDFTGDGRADYVSVSNSGLTAYVSTGSTFVASTTPVTTGITDPNDPVLVPGTATEAPHVLVDGDGGNEVAVLDLYNTGTGGIWSATSQGFVDAKGGDTQALAVADADGNGQPDAVVNDVTSGATILLNQDTPLTSAGRTVRDDVSRTGTASPGDYRVNPFESGNGRYTFFFAHTPLTSAGSGSFEQLYRYDATTSALQYVTLVGDPHTSQKFLAESSDDGNTVVYTNTGGSLAVHNVSAGTDTNTGVSGDPVALSGDGTVAFYVSGSSGSLALYRLDLTTNTSTVVNQLPNGTTGTTATTFTASTDGTGDMVAFSSDETDFAAGSGSGTSDVFVRTFGSTPTTTRIWPASCTATIPGDHAVSTDGNSVLLDQSGACAPAGATGTGLYVVNRSANSYVQASLDANNAAISTDVATPPNNGTGQFAPWSAALSGDGNHVAFISTANVTPAVSGSGTQSAAYVRDLPSNTTTPGSLTTAGTTGTSYGVDISDDGTVLAFDGAGTGITPGYTANDGAYSRSRFSTTTTSIDNLALSSTVEGGGTTSAPGATSVLDSAIPVSAIPTTLLNSVATSPLGSTPLGSTPLGSTPLGSTPLGSVPLGSTPLGSVPLGSVPLGSVPLGSTPLGSTPLGSTPLSEIPLGSTSLTWAGILASTPLGSTPLQDVTLAQVLALNPQPAGLSSLTISNVDLSQTPLGKASLASLALGSLPISSIPINGDTANATNNWCAYVQQKSGKTCQSLGLSGSSPLLAVDLVLGGIADAPLGSVPLGSTPLGSTPLGSVPLGSVPLGSTPLGSVPLGSVPLGSTPLGSTKVNTIPVSSPLGSVPVSSLPAGVVTGKCGNGACQTLGQALQAGAVSPSSTLADIASAISTYTLAQLGTYGTELLGDLLSHIDPSVGLTLAQVIDSLIPSAAYPYLNLPLEQIGVEDYANSGGVVDQAATFSLDGSGSAIPSTTVTVTLPAGWRYVAGSATFTGAGPAQTGVVDNTVPTVTYASTATTLVWQLPYRSANAGAVGVSYKVRPNLTLAPAASSSVVVTSSGGGLAAPVTATATSAGIAVGDSDESGSTSNNSPTTAPIVAPNSLTLGHISSATDVDYYRIPAPQPGTRVRVQISQQADDNDLVVYSPTGQQSANASTTSAPLGSTPLSDENLPAKPTTSLDSVALQDTPKAAGLTVAAASTNTGLAPESVDVPSDASSGYYTIQVNGHNGAFSTLPYVLSVDYVTPATTTCPAVALPYASQNNAAATTLSTATASTQTLFVVNDQRYRNTYGNTAASPLLANLKTFAARSEVGGAILDVDADSAVRTAYAAWDATPCNVDSANAVAKAIDADVTTVRKTATALKYVVIVGADNEVPFARIPDDTRLSNETGYASSDLNANGTNNAQSAAQAAGYFLSDDSYGTTTPYQWLDHQLFVPTVAMGRLVENPTQIQGQLDQWAAASGHLDPSTALTTGYDFFTDGAQAIDKGLAQKATTHTTLISPTWTKADLTNAFLPSSGATPKIDSLNAHADANRLLAAAGGSSNLFTVNDVDSTVGSTGTQLTGRLLFTIGCHAGLNVPDTEVGGPTTSTGSQPAVAQDWAETFSSHKAAVYVANTGYGLGDTDTVALSEQLLAGFATNLNGTLTAGQALEFAKETYFGSLGLYGAYDEKALQEATFYGLPMYTIGQTSSVPANPGNPTAAGASTTSVATDATTGLPARTVTIAPTFTKTTASQGTYWSVGGETQVDPYRPISPRTSVNVDNGTTIAHGGWLTALTSTDTSGVDPDDARPILSSSSSEPEVQAANVAFPSSFTAVTHYATPAGTTNRLILLPGQFRTDNTGTGTGTQRLFTNMSARVYYSTSTDTSAPALTNVVRSRSASSVTFHVDATDSTGVKAVQVLYKVVGTNGAWTVLPLSQVSGTNTWVGTGSASGDVDAVVQAVNAGGNVATSLNKGVYYDAPTGYAQSVLGAQGSNGWYTGPVTITVDGPAASYTATVDNGKAFTATPSFQITAQGKHTVVITGSDGSSRTLQVSIDSVAPLTYFSKPTLGIYTLNASGAGTVSCYDATSGVASCPGAVSVDTSTVGIHYLSINATDVAGNADTSVPYAVIYAFSGFLSPTSNNSYNKATAGSSVPLTWRLSDANGTAVTKLSAVTYAGSLQIGCNAIAPVSNLTYSTPSGLSYTGGHYAYSFSTPSSWKGTCRLLGFQFDDGTVEAAAYQFS